MKFNLLFFQDELARWIKGLPCNESIIVDGLKMFPDYTYVGYIYKGLNFQHPVDKNDIKNKNLSSWTSDFGVAMQFASKGRYKVILVKESRGISLSKLLTYFLESGQMISEKLATATITKYENEVLDNVDIYDINVMEPM